MHIKGMSPQEDIIHLPALNNIPSKYIRKNFKYEKLAGPQLVGYFKCLHQKLMG